MANRTSTLLLHPQKCDPIFFFFVRRRGATERTSTSEEMNKWTVSRVLVTFRLW